MVKRNKISPELKSEIKAKMDKGESLYGLAKEYKIPYATIYGWTHKKKQYNTQSKSVPKPIVKTKANPEIDNFEIVKNLIHTGFKRKQIEPGFYNAIRYFMED